VDETARVQRVLARVDDERRQVVAQVPLPERLGFNRGIPNRPLGDVWSPLSVFLHALRDE